MTMSILISVIKEYCKLARIHSAVLSGLVPILGALSVGMLDIKILFILFLIGVSTHIFGFVFNEYMDIDIDRKAQHLRNKPLVKGTISKTAALGFAFTGVIGGYLLTFYLVFLLETLPLFVIIFYTLSWVSIGIYDLTSKHVHGSDLALALWTGSLCLFGGFAVSDTPNFLLFAIAGLAFFQLLIQNILAGLKDLYQDKLGDANTTPLRMGAKLKRSKLYVPVKFKLYIYCLKIVHLLIVFIPIIFLWLSINLIQFLSILILLTINFILVFKIFNSDRYDRDDLLRAIGLHEIFSYSIVPIMFIGIIDLQFAVFLIIFPIIWLALFMKILFGQLLPGI